MESSGSIEGREEHGSSHAATSTIFDGFLAAEGDEYLEI
jgi:hypothetical protein